MTARGRPIMIVPAVAAVAALVFAGLGGSSTSPPTLMHQLGLGSPSGSDPASAYRVGNVTLGPPGAYPISVAYDAQTGNVYVSTDSSFIKVISTRNDSLVATVNIGKQVSATIGTMAVDLAAGDIVMVAGANSVVALSATNYSVVREIPVGQGSQSVLYDPAENRILVANFYSNNITVLNGTTLALVSSISIVFPYVLAYDSSTREIDVLGAYDATGLTYVAAFWDTNYSYAWEVAPSDLTGQVGPKEMAYDPANGDLYIAAGSPGNYVLILNATNGNTVGTVPVGVAPGGMAYDDRTQTVFVTNTGSDTVSAMNGSTLLFGPIAVGAFPNGITSAGNTGETFVSNEDSDTVSVINDSTGRVVTTVVLGDAPVAVTYVPGSHTVYAAGGQTFVAVSDTNHTVFAVTPVGLYPQAVAYDSRTGDLYVTNAASDTVSVISGTTDQIVATINVGSFPIGVAYDNASGQAFVACATVDTVEVISGSNNSLTATIGVGSFPAGMLYDPYTNDIFVTNFDSDNVSVISGSTFRVIATIALPLGSSPALPALDSLNGNVYVPDRYTGNVSVISGASLSVIATVVVGGTPFAAAYDPRTESVYVTNPAEDNVSVIDTASNTLVGNVTVGEYPRGIAYDNRTGEIYTANAYLDTLTYILPPAPPIPPLGVMFWVVLFSMVTFGAAGMLVTIWLSRTGPRSEVSRS